MNDEKLEIKTDTNNYKELFGTLRNSISSARDTYKAQLVQVKETIEQKKEELKLLEIKRYKLEGACEVSDSYLTVVLPSNNKKGV